MFIPNYQKRAIILSKVFDNNLICIVSKST